MSPAATITELHPGTFSPASIGHGDIVAEAVRWYARAPDPGAHVVSTTIGGVLVAVSTPHVYVWIDGVRLLHVRHNLWADRWGSPVQARPGAGVLITALLPTQGMLVRSGDEHHIVLDCALVSIAGRVYRHLLGQRSAG